MELYISAKEEKYLEGNHPVLLKTIRESSRYPYPYGDGWIYEDVTTATFYETCDALDDVLDEPTREA
ncbi:hypothetical protein SmaMPs15_000054 [Stenotrophomonas maltophilia phage vB_SmaM_Ps15]|uniref:Uncharacterized protein n=1 Tax=Stenotrophomonas maltophilia phage vB_SmaM_Ps15 TaxID=3071007 RepID=A0AAE9JUZ1_9CAUD|nr:hypothetical protein PQC01_gp054 [Stenotrophomonas maltophilia phage vB_SmaM_Ps15]UMO77205.1 hypothetical protein SmaMPs15_000054 [Stenotrophomonas maltophilia phage vB_SmaM_Ps15]